MYSAALVLHVLAAVLWVGGTFFICVPLRPALETADEPQRLALWAGILGKFFPWVWLCIAVLLATGFFMAFAAGSLAALELRVIMMGAAGVVMAALFKFAHAAPFRHLERGVEQEKWEVARFALGTLRKLALFNLVLGGAVIVIAAWPA